MLFVCCFYRAHLARGVAEQQARAWRIEGEFQSATIIIFKDRDLETPMPCPDPQQGRRVQVLGWVSGLLKVSRFGSLTIRPT